MLSNWSEIFGNFITEEQWEIFLTFAIEHLSFTDMKNLQFKDHFDSVCKECNIEFKKSSENQLVSNWNIISNQKRVKFNKGVRKTKQKKPEINNNAIRKVQWYYLSPLENTLIYMMNVDQAKKVLHNIMTTDWLTQITSVHQIPSNIRRCFSILNMRLSDIFKNITDDVNNEELFHSNLESNVHLVLPVVRMLHHITKSSSELQDTVENESDLIRPNKRQKLTESETSSGDNDDSVDMISNMENYIPSKCNSLTLLPHDSSINIIGLYQPKIIHPYTISVYLFCVAAKICKETNSTERDVYKNIVDTLAKPPTDRTTSERILIEPIVNAIRDYCEANTTDTTVLSLLEHSEYLLTKQKKTLSNICKSKGSFIKIVSKDYLNNGMISLQFDRNSVTPLSAYTTVKILQLRYMPWLKEVDITIEFDDNTTRFVMSQDAYTDLSTRVNYQLCTIHDSLERTSHPGLIFPYIVRCFATFNRNSIDSNKNILASMKILVKWFESSRISRSSNWPTPEVNGLCQYYLLLPIIMNRYRGKAKIIDALKSAYHDEQSLRYKKVTTNGHKKLVGFRNCIPNIYTAIKSFCFIKSKHRMFSSTVNKLMDLFLTKTELQLKYPLQYEIISHMYKLADVTQDTMVSIPFVPSLMKTTLILNGNNRKDNESIDEDVDNCDDEEEFDSNEKSNTQNNEIPCHLLLYSLCCDLNLIPDDIALEIFINTIYTQSSRMKLTFSAQHPYQENLDNMRLKYIDLMNEIRHNNVPVQEDQMKHLEYFNGLRILAESIEHMSYYSTQLPKDNAKYRGNVSVETTSHAATSSEICNPNVRCIPLQFDKECQPQFADEVVPIWPSEIYDVNFVPKRGALQSDTELLPFTGCHRDLLESVILYPCKTIKLV